MKFSHQCLVLESCGMTDSTGSHLFQLFCKKNTRSAPSCVKVNDQWDLSISQFLLKLLLRNLLYLHLCSIRMKLFGRNGTLVCFCHIVRGYHCCLPLR